MPSAYQFHPYLCHFVKFVGVPAFHLPVDFICLFNLSATTYLDSADVFASGCVGLLDLYFSIDSLNVLNGHYIIYLNG